MATSARNRVLIGIVLATLLACDASPPSSPPAQTATARPARTLGPYPTLILPTPAPEVTASPPAPPDPAYWTAVGSLAQERRNHAAVRLHDGRVMVTGGVELVADDFDVISMALDSVEIFDPMTGAWTGGPPLARPRTGHTATTLLDGRVLVGGGFRIREGTNVADAATMAEIFDPATEAWTLVEDVPTRHGWETATLLEDGRVLVIGPASRDYPRDEAASLFDPETGDWSPVPTSTHVRLIHVAVPLLDGTVLVAGGARPRDEGEAAPELDAVIYDPATNAWIDVGPMSSPGYAMLAARLRDGRVYFEFGGEAQRFDPPTRAWSPTPGLGVRLEALVPLNNGRLLAFLDPDDTSYPIVNAFDQASGQWRALGVFMELRSMTVTPLLDGRLLVAGGSLTCDEPDECALSDTANAWILDPAGGG